MRAQYFPGEDWQKADPEAVGMDTDRLLKLEREVETRYRSIKGFLVVSRGYLISERYLNGFGQDDKHLLASVTKSFISALIGIAIEQGFIEGVDQKVLDFFPEFRPGPRDGLKRQMTIKHLLTMTAGFQWRTGKHLHELAIDRMRRSKDWPAFIMNLPMQDSMFGRFQYNSAVSHLLSVILTRSTGKCAEEFAAENLFTPIAMEAPAANMQRGFSQDEVFRNQSGQWPQDPQGNNIGGWGLYLTPRDMARFGLLYVNGGQWAGRQIVPRQWVEESILPHTPGYGYQWWLRNVKGEFVFSAVGLGGIHIFCVPGKELVMVVASGPGNRWRDRWLLMEELVEALNNS